MSMETWGHYFKPEARSKGESLVKKGKVSPPRPSDTDVQMYVRESSAFKVHLQSESMDSNVLSVTCTCPPFKKGQFCRHIWAALLTLEENNPDFLEAKTELTKESESSGAESNAPIQKRVMSQAQVESQAAYKAKQSDYRKQQYQKQKQRLKDKKNPDKKTKAESIYPADVDRALKYFSDNGIPLDESLTKEAVASAKKQLSRVFHPDRGGSSTEILELNDFAGILERYLKS